MLNHSLSFSKKNNHSLPFLHLIFDRISYTNTTEYRHLIIIGKRTIRNESMDKTWLGDAITRVSRPVIPPLDIGWSLRQRICKLWKPPFKDKLFPETYLELGGKLWPRTLPIIELAAIEIVSRRPVSRSSRKRVEYFSHNRWNVNEREKKRIW